MADFKTFPVLIVCLLMMSCQLFGDKGGSSTEPTEIKGGYSFGFCAGYCKADFVFKSDGQSLVLKSHGRANDPPDLLIEEPMESSDWSQMIQAVDINSFCQMEEVYGCPDCADGGLEFLTMDCNGKDKTVNFEFGEELPEIRNLVLEIRPLRDSLVAQVRRR